MEYNHREIEEKWQKFWAENKTFKCEVDHSKPKYYVLDMFPYPSGAGLHVGHPLGYIASDIYSRYKRLKGFNVLHPMGFDAHGLPAEQHAIDTGTHPAITTDKNIKRYREQLDRIGFSYDWDREVRTSDPQYYKWTQWTFIQLFKHWYNKKTDKAETIEDLVKEFETKGNAETVAVVTPYWYKSIDKNLFPFEEDRDGVFTADEWKDMTEKQKQEMLMNYRLAYLSDTMVNWCSALGTVLANDEVKDCFSERGGHPVERKLMKQWSLRVSAYAQRLLDGLDKIDWFESLKEMQRYWIGRSEGGSVFFRIKGFEDKLEVFTTRPDTLWGATFMVLAPEHELVEKITTPDRKEAVKKYVEWAKNRSERERQAETKKITGEFTGAYGINPVNGEKIPIWIADYVLTGYGTGAIMAVPAHDSRDFAFARNFNLPIIQVVVKEGEEPTDTQTWEDSYDAKEGKMINSGFINELDVKDAIKATIKYLEENELGYGTVNYRLRDAIFSRQRYWGEPFPIYYKDGMPYALDESKLPLELPEVDKYLPTRTGEPPLARAENWVTEDGYPLETNTMPGFAGSSGYYLRYMDSRNDKEYFSREANEYWRDIDLYLGGDEHATGHLIYSRFWNMFLYDLGLVCEEEPFKKLINQGKIQGRSSFVYRKNGTNEFVSYNLRKNYDTTRLHVDINLVDNDVLDIDAFRKWRPEFKNAGFILEDGKYICGWEIEKMSKSKHNVQNPDDLIEKYGADTFRMYEMFLGPLENHKPWDTKGIEGVYRFIKKLWRLFYDEKGKLIVNDKQPNEKELKVLHQTIRKIQEDIERFSFNTAVSQFMICVNELTDLKCHKKEILEKLVILISPYAPHIAEELWSVLGNEPGISYVAFPEFNEEYIKENIFEYPVSFNGKMRFKLELPVDMPKDEIEKAVLAEEKSQKYIAGKQVRKVIIVPKKIINVVV
ncbi:MAG: leucine--tRNA ligase [Bacteroidales bacterium]|nr:leucine--tRNA ligase [Bacteroidales bacterium]